MNIEQAKEWIKELDAAIAEGEINHYQADDEVFAEMENGEHTAEVETFFYEYTRSN